MHLVAQRGVAARDALDERRLVGRRLVEHGVEHGVDALQSIAGGLGHNAPRVGREEAASDYGT